jgi:hypothetical protein
VARIAVRTAVVSIRDVARLSSELEQVHPLILGGGQLIRRDARGPVFSPATADVHDPLGIWLIPTLTALIARTPVAWNAPGVSPTIPPALGPLVTAVAALVDHLTVRDEQSARWFADAAGVTPAVVPNSAFALAGEARTPSVETRSILDGPALQGRPFVIVQPSPWLEPVTSQIHALLEDVAASGRVVLELPIGLLFREHRGRLNPLPVETRSLDSWPSPEIIAELIASADAAIGISFHLGVTAVAAGTPLFRPGSPPGWKYETLDRLPGVTVLREGKRPAFPLPTDGPAPEVLALGRRVDDHWDHIAELVRNGRSSRPPEVVRMLARSLTERLNQVL